MRRVVVVGGGISGLSAAWELTRRAPDVEVLVLEGSPRVGGKLATAEVGGVSVDVGAEALLARRPEGLELIDSLGLAARRIEPLTTSARVRAGGTLHPLPGRTMLGIPADLGSATASGVLSEAALARLGAEPGEPPLAALAGDVAVGALVRSRLGDEVADRLVEPLLGGVYAGRADRLSLRATMPALFARLAEHGGSLVEAARAVVRPASPADGAESGAEPGHTVRDVAPAPVFVSLRGGLGQLPVALAATGRFTVRTATIVREIERTAAGFRLTVGPVPYPEYLDADAVIVAAPAAKATRLLRSVAPPAASELAAIDYASVAIVTLAFRDADVDLPAGSGLLVAAREGLTVKGVTISSQKWPLDSDGLVLLRASVGRAGEPAPLQWDDGELIATVRRDLRALLGVTADPVDSLITRWGGGLPQYAVGHVERVERIRAALASVPGLAICGAAYDGIGIPACIASARGATAHVAAMLATRAQ